MGSSLRGLTVLLSVVAVGAFLGSALSQWLPDTDSGTPAGSPAVEPAAVGADAIGRVRVEVLNAAGNEGLARRATEFLRERGFDVVYFGNAERFDLDSTLVLDRVDRIAAARAVADSLGVRRVLSEPDSNLYLDVTVRLGSDWEAPSDRDEAVPVNPAPEGTRRWWDPRSLWRRDGAAKREGGR